MINLFNTISLLVVGRWDDNKTKIAARTLILI